LVGYLLGKGWDGRWMLVFGFTVASFAFFGYAHMTLESGTWDIFWVQIMQGTGMAFLFVPLTPLTMSAVLKQEMSYATSLYNTMRNIGNSVGVSFVTTWVARRSQYHQSVLSADISSSSLVDQQRLAGFASFLQQRGLDPSTAGRRAGGHIYLLLQQQASLLSYADSFYLMGMLFLAVIPVVFLLRKPNLSRR
jgi:DHA2 family multidrug resistance protein